MSLSFAQAAMFENRRRNQFARSLNYQGCEPRLLLAGNVNVHAHGDHLFIRGDSADNQIEIFGGNGRILVSGLDGTTINGAEDSYVVENSRPVVYENEGEFYRASGFFTPAVFDGGLRVNMGDGDDSIKVNVAHFGEESIVYGGIGDDTVDVRLSTFNESLVIQTFSGNDSVYIQNSSVRDRFFALLLDGDDVFESENLNTQATAVVTTGNGNDRYTSIKDTFQGQHQFVLAGDGDDLIEVDSPRVSADGLHVYGGAGNDRIEASLSNQFSEGKVTLGGQAGDDVADVDFAELDAVEVALNTFEAINYPVISSATYNHRNYIESRDSGSVESYPSQESVLAASRFRFDQSTSVSRVGWSGTYQEDVFYDYDLEGWQTNIDVPETDDFVVMIYEDDNGVPAQSPAWEFFVGDDVNREDRSYLSIVSFDYSADLDAELEGGKDYWISVFSLNEVGSRFKWIIGDSGADTAAGFVEKRFDSQQIDHDAAWERSHSNDVQQDLVFTIWTKTSSEQFGRGVIAFNN